MKVRLIRRNICPVLRVPDISNSVKSAGGIGLSGAARASYLEMRDNIVSPLSSCVELFLAIFPRVCVRREEAKGGIRKLESGSRVRRLWEIHPALSVEVVQ